MLMFEKLQRAMRRKLKTQWSTYLAIWLMVMIIYNTVKDYKILSKSLTKYYSIPVESQPDTNIKYILQWTSPRDMPLVYMGFARNGFVKRNCTYTNCYVTSDRNFFKNYSTFDVVVFAGPEVTYFWKSMLPKLRSPHQKYVYASIESAANYPVCTNQFDWYFNWTWTYKLDSDLRWGYIIVRDSNGKIVGPNMEMDWIKREDMLPVSDKLEKVLRGKTKTAAWFVSNCYSLSEREYFSSELNNILEFKYNLTIDIYGKCGSLQCSRENETICDEMIRKDYYFYLSFENALSEDYVTEKLLHAVQYNAIPIVFGGANYSRFLPEGSYLNVREIGVEKLATKMHELINNFTQYVEYFRWTNHYSYHRKEDSVETNDYCEMCALLNNNSKVKKTSTYGDFKNWWSSNNTMCYDNVMNYVLY